MRRVDAGERFVVTRNGVPVAELVPARRQYVSAESLVQAFRGAPSVDYARFRADIDAVVDQSIEPRA